LLALPGFSAIVSGGREVAGDRVDRHIVKISEVGEPDRPCLQIVGQRGDDPADKVALKLEDDHL
jgi:hypothetical protein